MKGFPDGADRIRQIGSVVLTYAPVPLAPALVAYTMFPARLRWTSNVFARVFGLAAAFYDDVTTVPGYGDALENAILEVPNQPAAILDLATGTGYVARRLKQTYPAAEVTGTDIASEMVAIAQHQSVAEGVKVRFQKADNYDLPFPDETFDLVVMQNAFPILDEMMRVLRPGGTLAIVWSFGGPWVAAAWSAMANRLLGLGSTKTWGRRAGTGFYGMATRPDPTTSAASRHR